MESREKVAAFARARLIRRSSIAVDNKKILVKVHPKENSCRFVQSLEISQITANTRVEMKADSYALHKVLPSKISSVRSAYPLMPLAVITAFVLTCLFSKPRRLKDLVSDRRAAEESVINCAVPCSQKIRTEHSSMS